MATSKSFGNGGGDGKFRAGYGMRELVAFAVQQRHAV